MVTAPSSATGDKWLAPALDYIPQWLDYQMRVSDQPGCVIAIVRHGEVVLEQAFGHAETVQYGNAYLALHLEVDRRRFGCASAEQVAQRRNDFLPRHAPLFGQVAEIERQSGARDGHCVLAV